MSDYGWSLVSVVTAPAPTPGSSGPAASAAVAPAGAARLSGYRPHLDGIRTVAERLGGHRFSQAVDPCRMDQVAVGAQVVSWTHGNAMAWR